MKLFLSYKLLHNWKTGFLFILKYLFLVIPGLIDAKEFLKISYGCIKIFFPFS